MAERQDGTLVRAILDYRAARFAMRLCEEGPKGLNELASNHPELVEFLLELHRAQLGDQVTQDEVQAMLRKRAELASRQDEE